MPGGNRDSAVVIGSDGLCASLDQLPSAALSTVHAALCSLPCPRDAAALRCTCRSIHDEVLLPEKLELSYPSPPQPGILRSLGLFLRSPQAAHTQLSISISDWSPIPENEEEDWGVWSLCDALREAGERLSELSLPCVSIGNSLCAVREFLPHVRSLVLRIDNETVADASFDTGSDSQDIEKSGKARVAFSGSQLTSLTLKAQPGIPPVSIFDHEAEMPLQLDRYPGLQHLVLVGPIVCEPGEPPFLLPAHTSVTIDPGLSGREPTAWARTPLSYRRFADMPEDAVPCENTYREEDMKGRMQRFAAFTKDLIDFTVDRKDDYESPRGGGHMFKGYPGSFIRAFSEGYCNAYRGDYRCIAGLAETIGCGDRSDLLWQNVNWVGVSDSLLWAVEMYVRGI